MKLYISLFQVLFFCSLSFAEPFQPTVLKLTVPAEISYKFDGSTLSIPVTVTGTPAAFYLVINTKGQAENIIDVRNGFLDWHYVNKIDTTIFVSPRFEREVGETTIIWDGIDENGNNVVPGSYDFYFWGYDYKSNRKLVCNFIKPNIAYSKQNQILEKGEDGLPLSHPLLVGNLPWGQCVDSGHESGIKRSFEEYGVHFKWEIGGDPLDMTLLHTTMCNIYKERQIKSFTEWPVYYYECPVFDPHDFNVFYHCCRNDIPGVSTMLKWQFITDGNAILDDTWLGWDNLIWEESRKGIVINPDFGLGCFTDGNYIYVPSTDNVTLERNILRCVSFDGDVVFEKMMHDWYFPPQLVYGKQVEFNFNGMFLNLDSRGNNCWFLSGPHCCLLQMINTSRLLIDPDDETDMVVFENRNGDYFLDVGFQPELQSGWFCNDYMNNERKWMTGATRSGICIDANKFNIIFTSYPYRAEEHSFAVMTQDGTGIDNMAFGDEAPFTTTAGGNKLGGLIVDSGSGYDGFYINRVATDDIEIYTTFMDWRTFYIAFDSCHGVITNNPTSVESNNFLQFKVEQNSPNPFNPSTVIRFTIPENGRVSVDIYNIAGQKIQMLVNDMMKAGTHSVIWDAGTYPSGVYIYKVKSGKFEKTMKMTLVK